MDTAIYIGPDAIQKTSIAAMSYDEHVSLLQKISGYRQYLDECYDYIADVSLLKYPEKYADTPGVISFGQGVLAKDILSFLHQIDGRAMAKIHS